MYSLDNWIIESTWIRLWCCDIRWFVIVHVLKIKFKFKYQHRNNELRMHCKIWAYTVVTKHSHSRMTFFRLFTCILILKSIPLILILSKFLLCLISNLSNFCQTWFLWMVSNMKWIKSWWNLVMLFLHSSMERAVTFLNDIGLIPIVGATLRFKQVCFMFVIAISSDGYQ